MPTFIKLKSAIGNLKISLLLMSLTLLLNTFFQPAEVQAQGRKPKSRPTENTNSAELPYKNAKLSINNRIEDLLGRMTLDEKIGEMTQLCASSITLDGTKKLDLNLEKIRSYILQYHVGSFLSGTGKAERWVDFITGIQKIAMTETRLGIPIIFGMDNVHGSNYTDEAIMLPHNLTLSCSFNPVLAAEAGRVTAIESADLGHHWNFAPVLDIGKNPYWPRLYETFGEDPYLCGLMGASFTKAFQECKEVAPYKMAACAKHFIGYSDPKYGWDRAPSEIPDQTIHEFFAPPFQAAFKAGIKTLMVNSGELNGEPVHGSRKILTDLLRNKMKFEGVVLTDIKDIMKMVEMHGAAHNEEEATLRAINAGIDMSMACSDVNFIAIMKKLVSEKKITVARIDTSVRRILKLKFELGLFENPYPSKARLNKIGSEENYQVALEAARESIVLLQNKNSALPLKTQSKVLLGGFAANSKRNLNGAWTLEWLGAPEDRQPAQMKTLFSALKEKLSEGSLTLADSAAENIGSPAYEAFKQQCQKADHIVLTIGEIPYSEFKGNAVDINLNPNQRKLVETALESGKPVTLIVISGRPVLFTDLARKASAVLFAGHPGQAGGEALAEILVGETNPSAKLSFSWPVASGHTVPYYTKKSEYHHRKPWEDFLPLYSFGQGESYTQFTYSNLSFSDTVLANHKTKLRAKVTVTNTGKVAGKEAVLWFLTDEVGTLTRPVKILKSVDKVYLKPNEKTTVEFLIDPLQHLSFPDAEANKLLEAGFFKVQVGTETKRFRLAKGL